MRFSLWYDTLQPLSYKANALPLKLTMIVYKLSVCNNGLFVSIDWWLFTVSRIFHLHVWRRHHCWWRATKFRPMLGAQGLWVGRDFIVPHLLWQGTSIFPVSSEGPPHSVAFYDMHEDAEVFCFEERTDWLCTLVYVSVNANRKWHEIHF
jgi:hypothetical protein